MGVPKHAAADLNPKADEPRLAADEVSSMPVESMRATDPAKPVVADLKNGIHGHAPKMSLWRKIALGFSVVLLLVGVGIILYPLVQQWLYDRNVDELVENFDARALSLREEAQLEDGTPLDLSALLAAMQAYNREIYENGQEGFRDAWSYQVPSFDLTEWGLPDNMVGYINIPAMGVTLPIYLGASEANMTIGAVHLSQTSLPIGGDNVNSVIAAHRGYWSGLAMFRDIELIEIGDEVYITNFWATLTYRVDEIKVILPTDTQEVLIQEGRDMVTLITCHPYGDNTFRYAVYCERVD